MGDEEFVLVLARKFACHIIIVINTNFLVANELMVELEKINLTIQYFLKEDEVKAIMLIILAFSAVRYLCLQMMSMAVSILPRQLIEDNTLAPLSI